MSNKNILDDLHTLVKRASEAKTDALKLAADTSTKLDNLEDGTSPATTGQQAAANMQAQKESYPEPSADVGAEDNKVGGSVEESTDEATAVSPTGQEGTEGSELADGGISEADNGPEDTDSPDNNGFNSGAFKEAAAACRERAQALRKQAEAIPELTPLQKFLAKSARASEDAEIRKTAEAFEDDGMLADAAAGSLIEQLESGAIGDEEATAILEEAINAGAITEDELAEAAGTMGGVGEEDMMEAKLAAADIGPDHPEYLRKLGSLYPQEINAGYQFGIKLAEEMAASEDDEDDSEEDKDKTKEAQVPPEALMEEAAVVGEEPAPAPAEVAPPEAEPAAEEVEVAAEGEDGGEESEVVEGEGSLEEELAPQGPEEEAALGAVGEELGLDEAALAQLLAAPVPDEAAAMELGKVAKTLKTAGVDAKTRFRTVLLNKVAALRIDG